MLDHETIAIQQQRLLTHRRTLAALLDQYTRLGDYTPPHVILEIEDIRASIARIKRTLRAHSVAVDDLPDDEGPPLAISKSREHKTLPSTGHSDPTTVGASQNINISGGSVGSVIGTQIIYNVERPPDPNRNAMLQKVKSIWIAKYLERSVTAKARLALGLVEVPEAVDLTFQAQYQEFSSPELTAPPRILSAGASVLDIFEEYSGALLILGEPGSGKTILLLELARDLIARAEQNTDDRIPVVFNLSSWALKRLPLATWLVDELHKQYQVSRALAQSWVQNNEIIPLLDGLDEVRKEYREACVTAINAYRRDHGMFSLVVCSRVADYTMLRNKLQLHGAILIQTLSPTQIDAQLKEAGKQLQGLREAFKRDATLYELAKTPLIFNIMMLTYRDVAITELSSQGTLEQRRHQLFAAYIKRMLTRRVKQERYNFERTIRRLCWLAVRMNDHAQSIYYLEYMQPSWLIERGQRNAFIVGTTMIGILVFTIVFILYFLIILFITIGEMRSLVVALILGLVSGGPIGLVCGLRSQIKPTEIMRWSSWAKIKRGATIGLVSGLIGGPLVAVASYFIGSLNGEFIEGLNMAARIAVAFLLGGMAVSSFDIVPIEERSDPNQGIHRSAYNALLSATVYGLCGGIAAGFIVQTQGSPFLNGMAIGIIPFFIGALQGGDACIQHVALRLVLWFNRVLPLSLIPFLDYCDGQIILRKVGGGYMFIHRLLLEYFVSLEQPANRTDASSLVHSQ